VTGSAPGAGERRACVTGVGVVAPGGTGAPAFWELLTAGRTATRAITLFDPAEFRSRIAAECDFSPEAAGLTLQEVARNDRYVQFALVAADEAVRRAELSLDPFDPWRVGVCMGTAVGGTMLLESDYVVTSNRGERWLSVRSSSDINWFRSPSTSRVPRA
jgi:minimal PKS ketosynthase (KS/KS alpha)